MNATQSFMDETEWVERYAWFGAMKQLQGVNEVIVCARYRVMLPTNSPSSSTGLWTPMEGLMTSVVSTSERSHQIPLVATFPAL